MYRVAMIFRHGADRSVDFGQWKGSCPGGMREIMMLALRGTGIYVRSANLNHSLRVRGNQQGLRCLANVWTDKCLTKRNLNTLSEAFQGLLPARG